MHPALRAFWESVRVAAGSGPLHHSLLFWAIVCTVLAASVVFAADGAPWQNVSLVPGMLAGMLWLAVFFQVAQHGPDSLLAFVGGMFLVGLFIDLVMRVLHLLRI